MKLTWIRSIEQLRAYEDDWNRILEERKNTNPFIEFIWIFEWWKHLGDECAVEIIVVSNHEKPIAFFPFVIKKRCLFCTYSFMALGQANYMDIVVGKQYLGDVIEFVFDEIIRLRKNVVFNLHGLLESEGTPGNLETYLENSGFSFSNHRVITPYIDLKKIKTEEYMKKRQRLHRLDRREKRLRSIGNVSVIPTTIDMTEKIFALHKKHWKRKHDTSGFTNDREKFFFQSLARIQDGPMTTEIDSLYLNSTMIAFNYGFNCRGRFLGYVLGFDNDFEAFSPGRILEKEKILQCKAKSYYKFDLSIGYETYKFDWNTDVDYTRKMIFSGNTIISKVLRRFLTLKELVIERIKQNHKLVLFKRNRVGNLLYIVKNLFNKEESMTIFRELVGLVMRGKKAVYERQCYLVYGIEKKDVPESTLTEMYAEFTIEDALSETTLSSNYMKEICRKIYGGFNGYYPKGKLEFENIFWTNEKVLRIDDISYFEDFRKGSVYIQNWNHRNLAGICISVKKSSKAKILYVAVKEGSVREVSKLEELGFIVNKKIIKKTTLGIRKFQVIDRKK